LTSNSIPQVAKAKEENKVVLVNYTAAWCGPCRVIAPVVDKLAEAADSSRIEFYKVDVDDAKDVARGVASVCFFYTVYGTWSLFADDTFCHNQMPTFRAYNGKNPLPEKDYAEQKGAIPARLEVCFD
jgi:thioredoxin 1